MAISSNSKLDFLWKKIIFGAAKTDSDLAKAGNNESIPSPLPVYSHQIWTNTSPIEIPLAPPTTSTSTVSVLKGTDRIQCTADSTAGGPGARPTWLTGLVDWIPPTFGSGYAVEVYLGDPEAGGIKIFPGAPDEEWVFDYNTGILHFPTNLPTSNPQWTNGVYIKGYRYTGMKGPGGPTGPPGPAGGPTGPTGPSGADGESAQVYRNRWSYTVPNLGVDSVSEFEIELGPAIIVYNLTVSKPVLVEIFGTAQKVEPNPYTFRATEDHLTDDGTTLLSDGTVIKTRQYSIFANLEEPVQEKVYARVTNLSPVGGPLDIDILYFAAVTEQPPPPSSNSTTSASYGTAFPSSPIIGELFLRTDEDTLYVYDGVKWVASVGAAVNAGGADTQVQFNKNGILDGSPKFTWEDSTSILTVDGTISGKRNAVTGGALTIKAGDSTNGDGATFSILGSNATNSASTTSTSHIGGAVSISAGTSFFGDGGHVTVSGGAGTGGNMSGGHVVLAGGTVATPGGNVASVIFKTDGQERIRINAAGALCISGDANHGTSGQILTSNGNGLPSWRNPAAPVAGGSSGSVQFNSSGSITGGGELVFVPGAFTVGGSLVVGKKSDASPFKIKGSSDVDTSNPQGASIEISGGDYAHGTGFGGSVYLMGGMSGSYGASGSTYIYSGLARTSNATAGSVILGTGTTSRAERLRITPGGAWGLNGANYGSTGQVLTSNGTDSPPSWQSIIASASSSIGDTGPMGPTGPTGAAGSAGRTGPTGDTGPVGPVGPVGPTGPTGPTGASGSVGPTGPSGSDGAIGSAGPTGPTGSIGPTGASGLALASGNTGQLQFNSAGTMAGTPEIVYTGGIFQEGGAVVLGKRYDVSPFILKGFTHGFADNAAGSVQLSGGDYTGGTGDGGSIYLVGGTAGSFGTSGSVNIYSGLARTVNSVAGTLYFSTGTTVREERLRITPGGAWGLSGANYGTGGQVLTSNGTNAAPSWQSTSSSAVQPLVEITADPDFLTLDRAGKCVTKSGGTLEIRPNIFSAGNQVFIYNSSSVSMTISEYAGLTLRLAGTPNTGNRSLAGYGFATVLFLTPTLAVIRGDGLT